MKKNKGITLIALVITIIVLIILAGVSINLIFGQNGIINKTKSGADATMKEQYKEAIEFEIVNEKVERISTNKEESFMQSLKKRIEEKEWANTVHMCDENYEVQEEVSEDICYLIVYTNDSYKIIVNVDNNKLLAKVANVISKSDIGNIEYNTNGGTGENIINQKTTIGFPTELEQNVYTRENYFFIGWCEDKDGNGKLYKEKEKIIVNNKNMVLYAIWMNMEQESIIGAISNLNETGIYTIKVENITYNIHLYCYNGNQVWSENQVFGDADDIGTASTNATRMVAVKVDGNLNIEAGVTVSPYYSNYGGPKGFFVYCTGTLTNNGTIQNNYGAKASGENVYMWKNADESYEYVPALGANGGASQTVTDRTDRRIKI